uniref:Uncharacterized protein n=1 Tax=Timema bartmani TaxID=61472 RepID=A0A7R9I4B5_9NEOP|nr:unnamed protein product [Timema bartmani]
MCPLTKNPAVQGEKTCCTKTAHRNCLRDMNLNIPGVVDSSSPASRFYPSEQGSSSKEQLLTSHLYPLTSPSSLAGISGVPGSLAILITGIPETPFLG